MKKSYLIFITFILLSSCNSIVKTIYDDTTARYNAYFIAKEEIKNITNIGNKGIMNQIFCWAKTISLKFNDPTHKRTLMMIIPMI